VGRRSGEVAAGRLQHPGEATTTPGLPPSNPLPASGGAESHGLAGLAVLVARTASTSWIPARARARTAATARSPAPQAWSAATTRVPAREPSSSVGYSSRGAGRCCGEDLGERWRVAGGEGGRGRGGGSVPAAREGGGSVPAARLIRERNRVGNESWESGTQLV
jgi:hypothetical protein